MPGIAGIISFSSPDECSARLRLMLDEMRHESFYKMAARSFPEMGIYAGAVSFENGDGIAFDENKEIALVFSGECFWDAKIADGKKLIELYKEVGETFPGKLNGLFSGLLIDKNRRKVFLFNDRFGIQRIYFRATSDAFYFASEAKALLRILPDSHEFDPEGVADFLTFGCVLDWKTLFRKIEVLPGGSLWTFENGRCKKGKYFSPETWEVQPQLTGKEFENRLQETFKRILPRYFEAASKIGIALTGGLDTRMIMACSPLSKGQAACYTFTGNSGQTLDDKIAARVAAAVGLDHRLLRLDGDFFTNTATYADKAVYATDGCAGIFNAHEIYFNQRARKIAPVRLTGNYGSEIVRSISTFKKLPLTPQLFNPELRQTIASQSGKLSAHKGHPVTFAAFKEVPWNLFGNLAAGRSQLHFRTPYLDNELVALMYQAPEEVRKSSLPSFSLVRANHPTLSKIPTDRGFAGDNSGLKFLWRRVFAETTFKLDYYNTAGLPRSVSAFNPFFHPIVSKLKIAGLHKFLRYGPWFRKEMAPWVREVLSNSRVRGSSWWNPEFLKTLADAHIGGRNDFSVEINAVMTLEAVERLFFHKSERFEFSTQAYAKPIASF
ncbi:MAG TPA: asparagine synthase-related protein [Pseudomonadales bacterium]|nr:asparagine synthase-related protein [Pseudomonadales bacterium]